MKLRIDKRYLVILPFCIICAMYSILLFDRSTILRLTAEDGVIETLGAMMFLISSVGFGLAYLRSSRSRQDVKALVGQTRKNIFYLLLSLLFVVGFLEEVSWGQRVFNIETPEIITKFNVQKEINIHNLEWLEAEDRSGNRKPFLLLLLNIDRLYSIFVAGFCVLVPLLNRHSQRVNKAFTRIQLPVIPIQFGYLFALNYIASKVLRIICPAYVRGGNIVEIKETASAFLFACVALGQVYRLSKGRICTGIKIIRDMLQLCDKFGV